MRFPRPRALLIGFGLLALAAPALAQAPEYITGQVEIDGLSYPYSLLPPTEIVAGQTYPLILFLHGAGERGNDNRAQRNHFPARMAKGPDGKGAPCFVLAPQCPKDGGWTTRRRGSKLSAGLPRVMAPPMRAAIAALQEVVRTQPVDVNRMSLTGLSMGGFGTWDLAARHPEWFSAAIPICGGGDPANAALYAGLPMQVWHGAADTVVRPAQSRVMIGAMKALQIPVDYHELPGVRHNSWTQAYRDESCLDLLLNHQRNPAAIQTATAQLLAAAIDKEERIAFLGDSITQAGNRPDGYLDQIRSDIAAQRPQAVVIPAGISGHKVPDLLKRYRKDVLEQKATMVFLYIGINDVWHSTSNRGTPIEDFEAGLRTLVRDFQASGAEVVLATPSVIGERPRGENPLDTMLADFATRSRKVAREEGATLCDLSEAFHHHLALFNPKEVEKGVLTSDGVHLNPAGNTFVATHAARALYQATQARKARRQAEQSKQDG